MAAIADRPRRFRDAPPVIDVEASGFGRGSYPIEVGYVLADGASACMLVRPEPRWDHWDAAAEGLHRISRDLLIRHGVPVRDVVERLNRDLAGLTVYTDGWGNDYPWLSILHDVADRPPTYRLDNLQKLLTEDELGRWDRAKADVLAAAPQPRHRASADARLLQATVVRLLEQG